MRIKRILAGTAMLVASLMMVAVVHAPTAKADSHCGENFHVVGKGTEQLLIGGLIQGQMNVQFNPTMRNPATGLKGMWCFLVQRSHTDIMTAAKAKYHASHDWNIDTDFKLGFTKVNLWSNGGRCVDMLGEVRRIGTDKWESVYIERCRAAA